ncbi:hypothetical protein BaRGS_00009748 [Batillaria attramentaria]|uniref:Uncharacterized protein n=1 Tax=Batillaria attramentaria TaxID=370345 RepID=A0ABD0LIW9_9CAEN
MDNQILLSYARQVKFVTTNFHQVRAADELYDPTSQILSDLLSSQGLLPVGDFTQSDILKKLRKLGLRTETNVLFRTSHYKQQSTSRRDFTHHNVSAALKASEALWKFLKNHGETFHSSTLARLSSITCMPCLRGKPEGYPASLPLRSAVAIGRPDELCSHKLV